MCREAPRSRAQRGGVDQLTGRIQTHGPDACRDCRTVAGGRGQIAVVPQNGDAKRAGEARVIGHRTLNLGAKVMHGEVAMVTDFIETAPRKTVQFDARSATIDNDVSALKTTHFGTVGNSTDPAPGRIAVVFSAKPRIRHSLDPACDIHTRFQPPQEAPLILTKPRDC